MARLCVIPARGGSKRIPGKNIRDFLGRPIISYSIVVAIESRLFDEVMVSTDNQDIATIAKQCGASVPFLRSEPNSDDFATTIDVIAEVVEGYARQSRYFDSVCCLYPTAPLVQKNKLTEGLNILNEFQECEVVFPVVAFSSPVWRGLRLENNHVEMVWPQHQHKRSQDLEVVYHDAGQWYWMKPSVAQLKKPLFGPYSRAIVLDDLFVQDIDNLSDWKLAELKYKLIDHDV